MARQNKYDKMFQGKSLKDLQAIKPHIDARLNDFIEAKNEAQTATYKAIQASLDKAIASQKGAIQC